MTKISQHMSILVMVAGNLRSLGLLFGFSVVALYCQYSNADEDGSTSAAVNHVVLVWFKAEHRSDEFLEAIVRETLKLKDIDAVRDLRAGKSIANDRRVVDDSFDMGIWILFDNAADRDSYVEHPLHVDYLQRGIEGKVEKLVIYDF